MCDVLKQQNTKLDFFIDSYKKYYIIKYPAFLSAQMKEA